MNWFWVFLSFRGRLGAAPFKKAASILIAVCFLPSNFAHFFGVHTQTGWLTLHLAFAAFDVAAIWPWLALSIKRLHDSGRTMMLAVPAALALPFADAVALTSDIGRFAPPQSYVTLGLGPFILIGFALFELTLGAIPGTAGPNRFGPEPADA